MMSIGGGGLLPPLQEMQLQLTMKTCDLCLLALYLFCSPSLSLSQGPNNEIQEPFAKFVDSPYYSKSKLCGGAVTVSFSKYFSWQAMHFLQRSTHFWETCCRPFAASFRSLGAPFSWLKKPRSYMRRNLDCMGDVIMGFHQSTFSKPNTEFNSDLAPMRFLGFSNHEKGAPRQEISEWSTVCSTFSRSGWSVAKGGTSKSRPSPYLHKIPTRSNKVSPRTLQRALVYTKSYEHIPISYDTKTLCVTSFLPSITHGPVTVYGLPMSKAILCPLSLCIMYKCIKRRKSIVVSSRRNHTRV
jgi:hypothetical protein